MAGFSTRHVFTFAFDVMWYYERHNQQNGPVSQEELVNMFLAGEIGVDNLVWRQGLTDWVKLCEAEEICAAITAVSASQDNYTPLSSQTVPAQSARKPDHFDEAEKDFSPTPLRNLPQAIQQASVQPQATLAPIQVRQATPLPPAPDFRDGNGNIAGLGMRFLAVLVDTILALVIFGCFLSISRKPILRSSFGLTIVVVDSIMTFLWGGTPGKLLCGLRVIRANGTHVGLLRAFARAFCKQVCGLGWFIAIVGDEHCALHDMLCDTRVVNRN